MRGKTTRTKRTKGGHYTHHYYWCKNKTAGSCDAPPLRQDWIEQKIVGELNRFPLEARAAALEAIAFLQKQEKLADEGKREHIQQLKRTRWEEAYAAGLLTLSAFKKKLQGLEQAAPQHFSQALSSPHPSTFPVDDKGLTLLTNWNHVWLEATEAERKLLASCLIQRLEAELDPTAPQRCIRLTLLNFH